MPMGSKAKALELFHRGWECQQGGDLKGAVRLYQASIAEEPTAEAHTFLGWVYSFEDRYEEAIAECKRAIAADPTFGNPYNDIGVYLMELGRPDEAIPWLERAMQAPRYESPQFPHMNLARIHEARGDLLDAVQEFSKGLEKDPDYLPALHAVRRLQQRLN